MAPTEPPDAPSLLAAFFRDEILPRGDAWRASGAAKYFLSAANGEASADTFFVPPVVSQLQKADFEVPELDGTEALAGALLELWRKSGAAVDPDLARKLAELAWVLKSSDDFDAEPPPFIYTL